MNARDKSAQAARFSSHVSPEVIAQLRRSSMQRVAVVFKGVDLVCVGDYTPNSHGFCDNGGFCIDTAEVLGVDVLPLMSPETVEKLQWDAFEAYEADL